MRSKLKYKVLAGFMILVMMLAVAGAVSIYEFSKLAQSVDAVIDDNYKSIEACHRMIKALEREDSGVLTILLGNATEGKKILLSSDTAFHEAFDLAKNNITEQGEDTIIQEITKSYNEYRDSWTRVMIPVPHEEKIAWYSDTMHASFLLVRNHVEDLMSMNQASMYNVASDLKEKSKRAIMPGIVAIISALVFSLMLNFFITQFFVRPLERLAKAVDVYQVDSKKPFSANLDNYREITKLEKSISALIEKLRFSLNPKEEQ